MPASQDTDPHLHERYRAPFGRWPELLADEDLDRADVSAPVRGLLTEVQECAERLAEVTGWERDQLLDKAGCTASRRKDPNELADELLERCHTFLGWVERCVMSLDSVPERRLVVSGASRLLKQAGKDVELFVAATDDGNPSCIELITLGELGFAWQEARRHLPGTVGDRARRMHLSSPYTVDAPHLSPKRVVLLLADSDRLGDRVAHAMHEHLRTCDACAAAYPKAARREFAGR